jgi:hypothetical protein
VIARITVGEPPPCNLRTMSMTTIWGYYLADDIYLTWSTFVKTIQESKVGRESFYKRIKETIKGQ